MAVGAVGYRQNSRMTKSLFVSKKKKTGGKSLTWQQDVERNVFKESAVVRLLLVITLSANRL